VMWCGREEEDEEARARWGMCIEAVALYNGSTPYPLPSRDFGKTHLTRCIPSQNYRMPVGHQMRKVGYVVKSH